MECRLTCSLAFTGNKPHAIIPTKERKGLDAARRVAHKIFLLLHRYCRLLLLLLYPLVTTRRRRVVRRMRAS